MWSRMRSGGSPSVAALSAAMLRWAMRRNSVSLRCLYWLCRQEPRSGQSICKMKPASTTALYSVRMAPELKALIDSGADIAIFDSRSYEEYHDNSIPTAISVPGAELVYRFADLVPSVNTTVIVNCGGRTRSIIGAQALRNAGFPNKIMSLKDGTMAWHLAGYGVINGAVLRPPAVSEAGRQASTKAAARVAAHCDIRSIDKAMLSAWRSEAEQRTLYVLDVRTPEEYEA